MIAIRLKTEHLFDPLGIDIRQPRLFWNCEGGVKFWFDVKRAEA